MPPVPFTHTPHLTRQAASRAAKRLQDELEKIEHPLPLMKSQDFFARIFGFPDWRTLQDTWQEETLSANDTQSSSKPRRWLGGKPSSWLSMLTFLDKEGWTRVYLNCGFMPEGENESESENLSKPGKGIFFEMPELTPEDIEAFMAESGIPVPKRPETTLNSSHQWSFVLPGGNRWLAKAHWSFTDMTSHEFRAGWQVELRAQTPIHDVGQLLVPAGLKNWLKQPRSKGVVWIKDLQNAPWSLLETAAAYWARQQKKTLHTWGDFISQGINEYPDLLLEKHHETYYDASLYNHRDSIHPGDGLVGEANDTMTCLESVRLAEKGCMVWTNPLFLEAKNDSRVCVRKGRIIFIKPPITPSVSTAMRSLRLAGKKEWERSIHHTQGFVVTKREWEEEGNPGYIQWLVLDDERREALLRCQWGKSYHHEIETWVNLWMKQDGSDWQPLSN